MNSLGRLFRLSIWGESHGAGIGIVIDGCPAGLSLSEEDFIEDLDRRRPQAVGGTPRRESDKIEFLGGIFEGRTTGSPLSFFSKNTNIRSRDYAGVRDIPRPGHADFVAHKKFGGYEDYRGGGHFSGRLSLAWVIAGVVAKKLLSFLEIRARILEIGGFSSVDEGLAYALEKNDSIGGIIGCEVKGLPIGLGEPFFDSVESLISHAIFSIPAIKGIDFGSGFGSARMLGSEHNDALEDAGGTTRTNHSGGIVGGLSNGNPLYFKVAVKPTSSTPQAQRSYNLKKGQVEEFKIGGRHDLCIALRVPVIVEAATAVVLSDLYLLEKGFRVSS
ncbi:MAG: chorismate synthase [Cytophagales bacterium]|nr:chorismate synthase [Cytophagales bacterium]